VRDLLVHQGVVHRWATAALHGERLDRAATHGEGAASGDLLEWLGDGVDDLLRTLDRAPEDLDGWFFLADPPPTRLAWARRQCHETTVHAVDAMATSLGHPPTARQLWFGARLAADGVDELLTGFLPRERTSFRPGQQDASVVVRADDARRSWTIDFRGDEVPTVRRAGDAAADSQSTTSSLRGSAVDLYLALWNRGGPGQEVEEGGEPFLAHWAQGMKVTFD
jgi:hypothetical protein